MLVKRFYLQRLACLILDDHEAYWLLKPCNEKTPTSLDCMFDRYLPAFETFRCKVASQH